MTEKGSGRASRRSRTVDDRSGAWESSSQDFVRLAGILFASSRQLANGLDGNCSLVTLAGIPMLFSALRCLLVELNAGMHAAGTPNKPVLSELAGTKSDVEVIVENYPVEAPLVERLRLLWEVRNEIVHPAHRPSVEPHHTPTYLQSLRDAGLLQSKGTTPDYSWLAQLQSHRLFRWAFETIQLTVEVLVAHHRMPPFVAQALVSSYARYQLIDAA